MTQQALANLYDFLLLVPLGFVVSAYGSLIGAGGGFVLVPLLFLIMPDDLSPATVTSMSLTVVFFNAYAGTLAYARMKRIYYYYGVMFALAGVPAVILGTSAVRYVPRQPFAVAFGMLLCALGVFLALRPAEKAREQGNPMPNSSGAPSDSSSPPDRTRLGVVVAAYVQFCAGLMGIGGGIIQVPFLIKVMRFRPHVATATSLFILSIVCFVGIISHAVHDFFDPERGAFFITLDKSMYLAVGALMGAPVGASISQRVRASGIVRLLALALCIVGGTLVWKAVMGQA